MNTAVTLSVEHIDSASYSDTALLEKIFTAANKRFFKGAVQASIIWEVPKGTVAVSTGTKGDSLIPGSETEKQFETATRHIKLQNFEQAVPLLINCAEANHPDSKLLLSHILKRKNDERWQHYAASYNQHFATIRVVPAACYYPESKTIAIHPHLQETNTPQFVLKYLIYHECCHQLIECSDEAPHTDEFMQWEYKAPNRDRALDWLENKGFPTLRTANDS